MRKTGLIIAISLLVASCGSLLEVEPSNNLSGDIFTDEESIQNALNGAYFNLGGINGGEMFGGDFQLIPSLLTVQSDFEMAWDDINGASYTDFEEKNIQAINGRVEASWRRAYETINVLNSILENIENVENTSSRSRIQGEALAMRAIIYFEMARLWGPEYRPSVVDTEVFPLLLESVDIPGSTPAFNTLGEVYTQVEANLATASTLLESLGTNGTGINYYTCQAYLMRSAMHKNAYDDAITFAENIIDDNVYSLAATPLQAFNNTSNTSEDIFAIQQTQSNNAGSLATGTGVTNFYSSLTNQGLGAVRIREAFLNNIFGDFDYSPEYDSIDLRYGIDTLSTESTIDDLEAGFYVNVLNTLTLSPFKYGARDRVIPVIRYAEILLSRAEILAFQNPVTVNSTALADYNAVRTRAGLPALDASDFDLGVDLYDSILVERRREFLYEGQLFHDLRRLEAELNGTPLSDPQFILPIPQSEQDAGGNQ